MRSALLDYLADRLREEQRADPTLTVADWCGGLGISPAWWHLLMRGDSYLGVATLGNVSRVYGEAVDLLILDYCREVARTRQGAKGRRPANVS